MSSRCCRCWITTGAVLLGLATIAGAYAAHGIEDILVDVYGSPEGFQPPERIEHFKQLDPPAVKALRDFRTGVRYHVWHALGMMATGLIGLIPGTRRWPLELAAWSFGLGIIGFSGSLYGLSLTGNASFGLVAPVGGTLMILAWFFLAAGVCPCGTQAPRD